MCSSDVGMEPGSVETSCEELAIHRITAITAFPFHWDPSRHTHTHGDPPLYLEQGMPSLLLFYNLGSRRLMSKDPACLFSQKAAPFTRRPLCEIQCIYHRPSLQSGSRHTTPPSLPRSLALSVLALPAAAHKPSKPSSTYSHCSRPSKGGWRGDVEKELCLFKHVFKKREGDLLNAGPYGFAPHNMKE